jgi:alkanesulfonate monooxygenase SsuD/methylene tetrahydromethanopterin reductase-like flavin-dependent oxidoreductase (luciferase family)
VAPIYMREPTYVAQLAATLDELSGGRAAVVFGIGNIAMLEQCGIEWRGTRPIARLREAHKVMRTVLDEGAIDFKGDFYSYTGVTTAARPVQERLPLKVGAMGGVAAQLLRPVCAATGLAESRGLLKWPLTYESRTSP